MVENNEFRFLRSGTRFGLTWPVNRWAFLAVLACSALAMPVVVHAQSPDAERTPQVTITTADGKTVQGEMVEIDERGVHFDDGSTTKILPLEDLSLVRAENPNQSPLPMRVQLAGGSQLRIAGLVWSDQTATITPARQSPIEIPVTQLRWVRFRTGNTATDPTWLGWLEEARRGDRLIVRRNEKALDAIDGTVVAISREAVDFEMRGNPVSAPIAKLEGVMLSNQAGDRPAPAIRLTDTSGSVWAAESIRWARQTPRVRVRLSGSLEHEIPIEQIQEFRFAGGVLALAEAEVASASFGRPQGEASRAALKPALVADMKDWFEPRPDGGVIRVNTPGDITFRIPAGYQRFAIAARRDREVSQFNPVELAVLLDGKVKWTGTLQDRQSLGLELELADARQLTLRARPLAATSDTTSDSQEASAAAVDGLAGAALGGAVQWFSGRLLK